MHALVRDRDWTAEVLRDDSDLSGSRGAIDDVLVGLPLLDRARVRAVSFYEAIRMELQYQLGRQVLPRPVQDDLSGCVHMIFKRENATYRAELELLEEAHNQRIRTEVKVFNGRGALPIQYEDRVFEGGGCKPEAVRYLNQRRDTLNCQYFS